jgi:hypothetical protein
VPWLPGLVLAAFVAAAAGLWLVRSRTPAPGPEPAAAGEVEPVASRVADPGPEADLTQAVDVAPFPESGEPPSGGDETPESAEPPPEGDHAPLADAAAGSWDEREEVASSEGAAPSVEREPARASDAAANESYWRSRASQARSRVAAAESRVRELEGKAARGGPLAPGPLPPACQAGVAHEPGSSGLPPVKLRDYSRGAVHCDSEILRQQEAQKTQAQLEAAREAVRAAQEAVEDLEEEARRAGAHPGWLR